MKLKDKKAKLYRNLENKKVKCTACNHYCSISEDETGICGIRQNIDGDLYLLTYGNPIAIHVDPVEKKPLYHFYPGSKVLSIGTYGCNFRCAFCQNWDMSQRIKDVDKKNEVIENKSRSYTPQELVNYCLDNKISSIAYTYNEPAVFIEYAYDVMKLAHQKDIKNIFVSNGYESEESIDYVVKYLDAINIDLKAYSEKFYKDLCGGRLQPVLDNIKRYYQEDVWMEITTLIIPGENDSVEELTEIANFIKSISSKIPWHISRFSPAYKMSNKSVTSMKTLKDAYEIGKEEGLDYIYVGNIIDTQYSTTYCSNCGELLIERNWNSVKVELSEDGKCNSCGKVLDGHS